MRSEFSMIRWLNRNFHRMSVSPRKGGPPAVRFSGTGLLLGVYPGSISFSRPALIKQIGIDLAKRLELIGNRLIGKDEPTARRIVLAKVEDFIAMANSALAGDFLFVAGAMREAVLSFDPPTGEHQIRVAELCRKVAAELGLSEKEELDLGVAGLLHDFGKVGLSRADINDTQRWTEEKRKILGSIHLTIGLAVAESITSLRDVARIIRCNHYYNGYPKGIENEEIPLEGQILSAVDCFDAETNPRPSRGGASRKIERALGELEERGRSTAVRTPYDPRIIVALRKLVLSPSNPG